MRIDVLIVYVYLKVIKDEMEALESALRLISLILMLIGPIILVIYVIMLKKRENIEKKMRLRYILPYLVLVFISSSIQLWNLLYYSDEIEKISTIINVLRFLID